jgi:hypothetical protein
VNWYFLETKGHFRKKWLKIEKNLFCHLILEFFRNSNQFEVFQSYKITGPYWLGNVALWQTGEPILDWNILSLRFDGRM